MQNDMTTSVETFEKERFCGFPHRHGDATGKPATRDKTRGCRKNSISCETSSNFAILWTSSNRLECHKVPRLPRKTTWQPAWTHSKRRGFAAPPETRRSHRKTSDSRQDTWEHQSEHFVRDFRQLSQLATWQKDRFCSFPHRHGEATGKPETRDETRGSTKTSISCETSSNFHTL